MQTENNKNRFAFIIPVYNHAATVAEVIKQVARRLVIRVFVVDEDRPTKHRSAWLKSKP